MISFSKAAAERCVITRQGLIEKAEAIYAKAIEAGQLSAAVAATKEIGVLTGIRVERRESGDAGEFAKLEAMNRACHVLARANAGVVPFRSPWLGPERRGRAS